MIRQSAGADRRRMADDDDDASRLTVAPMASDAPALICGTCDAVLPLRAWSGCRTVPACSA